MDLNKPHLTLNEFYPVYLSQHANRTNRRLHFMGTTMGLVMAAVALATQNGWLLAAALIQAYTLAWTGHYFFEKNKPATFGHPVLSILAEWRMWRDILAGKIRL